MSETEQAILRTLVELEGAVKAMHRADPKPDLQALFNRIDGLAAQLPGSTAPDLLHYLKRKSYEKARLWLEGRRGEVTAGACGR